MGTIGHYANAQNQIAAMTSILAALRFEFEQVAARTDLDDQHLDLLVQQGQALVDAAEELKTVDYNPTPDVVRS